MTAQPALTSAPKTDHPGPFTLTGSESKAWTLVCILVATVLAAWLLTVAWGWDRGLNLRDEGFALLCREHPATHPYASSFAFFMADLPRLVPDAILNLRLFHVLAQLGSGLLLSLGFLSWIGNYLDLSGRRVAVLSLVMCTLLGNLLCFSVSIQALSYDGVTAFLTLSSAGCLFFALSKAKKNNTLAMAPWMVAAGMLLGLSFFAKFSACIAFYVLTLASIFLLSKQKKMSQWLWHLLGIMAGFSLFFLAYEDLPMWLGTFKMMVIDVELYGGGSHGPGKVMISTLLSLIKHMREIVLVGLALVVMPIVQTLLNRFTSRRLLLQTFLTPSMVVAGLILCWLRQSIAMEELHSSMVYWPAAFIGLTAVVVSKSGTYSRVFRDNASQRKALTGVALLALMPFAASLGTDSPLLWHAIRNMGPLTLSLGCLSLIVESALNVSLLAPVFIAVTVLVSSVQFVSGYVFNCPDCSPLAQQTESLSTPTRVRALKLEPSLAQFIRYGNSCLIAHGFKEGDPILALYDSPGFIYAVGGTSPGYAWYGINPEFQGFEDYFLPRLHRGSWKRLFIMIGNRQNSPFLDSHATELLRKSGVNFPADFDLIGRQYQPYVYGGRTCYFYALNR